MELVGTEAWTLELSGRLSPVEAERLVAGLPLARVDGEAELGLLIFGMTGLAMSGLPWPRFDYGEALWRIGVRLDGQPAWFGHTCDLDRALIGAFGRWMVRYPVRRARIAAKVTAADWRITVGAEHELAVLARPTDETPEPVPPRPIVVGSVDRRYRIPWREDPAPYRRTAEVKVTHDALSQATLGTTVRWRPRGVLHRGRVHRCGLAQSR